MIWLHVVYWAEDRLTGNVLPERSGEDITESNNFLSVCWENMKNTKFRMPWCASIISDHAPLPEYPPPVNEDYLLKKIVAKPKIRNWYGVKDS